jgi:hypothetical protein
MRSCLGLLTTCLLGACAAVPVTPGQEFSLRLGQYAHFNGTDNRIIFERVLEDSRCPVDARCVVAGTARIRVIARNIARDARGRIFETLDDVVDLTTDADGRARGTFYGDYRLELRRLEPVPTAGRRTRGYRALLYIEVPR